MRQIALDTETTGLNPGFDHIIEIGAIELIDRRIGRHFHAFIRPPVTIAEAASAVHGLTDDFLKDKPVFSEIEEPFLEFLTGAGELLIHNAPFDMRFLSKELSPPHRLDQMYRVTDTLALARSKNPGKRANLDALCKHYDVQGRDGKEHGALVDARILANVYLAMTREQSTMELAPPAAVISPLSTPQRYERKVFLATPEEAALHAEFCRVNKIACF